MTSCLAGDCVYTDPEDGSNVLSRALERASYRKEKLWQRLISSLNRRPVEPFNSATLGRKLFDVLSIIALLAFCAWSCAWQVQSGKERIERMRALYNDATDAAEREKLASCVHSHAVIVVTVTSFAITLIIHASILLISSTRFELVFPSRKLNYSKWRRQLTDASPGKHPISYSQFALAPTVRSLRATVERARNGELPLDAPTKFLLSANGRAFLNRAARRLHDKVALVDNELVRVNRRGVLSFFLVTLSCVMLAMAASYDDSAASDQCRFRVLLLAFLEKFTFTLLTVFALASFAGLSNYAQLLCVPVRSCPFTDDEKFLISLVAANSEHGFRGFACARAGSYANVDECGDAHVFVPIHASLFAYRPACTAELGDDRTYSRNAHDCFENYDMY